MRLKKHMVIIATGMMVLTGCSANTAETKGDSVDPKVEINHELSNEATKEEVAEKEETEQELRIVDRKSVV